MDLALQGCAAIVGGASAGLGRAIARSLAAEGCHVTAFARRAALLDELVAEIAALPGGGEGFAVVCDATREADIARAVDETVHRFGRIDIVINNTGGPPAGDFADVDDLAWRAAFELTAMSAIRLTRRALPFLRQGGRGRVVNITGSEVKEPYERILLSNAIRPVVTAWAKHLSKEEARHGVTVNSIAPGFIDTPLLTRYYSSEHDPDAARRRDEAAIPAGRFGSSEEIAATAAFLCSMGAAYINGVTLVVDGGQARGVFS